MFLLGFYIGRKGLFVSSEKNLRFWQNALIVAAIAFAPLYTLKELIMTNETIVQQSAGTAFDMWQKLAFTFVLVASFMLLYQNKKFCKWWLSRHKQGPLEYIWHKWTWMGSGKA